MVVRKFSLVPRDRKKLAVFMGQVLDNYKRGEMSKDEAIGTLSYVMTALDTDNIPEAMNWMEQSERVLFVSSLKCEESALRRTGRVAGAMA